MKTTLLIAFLILIQCSLFGQWKKLSEDQLYTDWDVVAHLGMDGDILRSTEGDDSKQIWHYQEQVLTEKLSNQSFSSFQHVRSMEDGTYLFEGKDSASGYERLYLFNGTQFIDITPPTGPWSYFHYPVMPSDSMIYVFGTRASDTAQVLSFTDRTQPWSQFTPPGDALTIDDEYTIENKGIFLNVRYFDGTQQLRHLFYHQSGTAINLTPMEIPFDYRFNFRDHNGNVYYSISTDQFLSYYTLHCYDGIITKEIDLGVDSFDLILSYSYTDDRDRLLIATTYANTEQIIVIDSLGQIEDITPDGVWADIKFLWETEEGIDFFSCQSTTADSILVFSFDGTSVNQLTTAGYWLDVDAAEELEGELLLTLQDGLSGDEGLYKSDGNSWTMLLAPTYNNVQVKLDQYKSKDYIEIVAYDVYDEAYLFHQGIFSQITPPGSWSYLNILAIDSIGNTFLNCETSNDSAFLFHYHTNSGHANLSQPGHIDEYYKLLGKENKAYFYGERDEIPLAGNSFKWTPDTIENLHWLDTVNTSSSAIEGYEGALSFVYQSGNLPDEIGLIIEDQEVILTPPIQSAEFQILDEGHRDSSVYFVFYDSSDYQSLWLCDLGLRNLPCETDYNFIYDQSIESGTYLSEIEIFSTGRIPTGNVVSFGAALSVSLQPDFVIDLGANLEIQVPTPCN